ncbi:MAG: PIN domain-containing protein [Alphaproteobacteria bacterium]|nr:PIN domain-containing protein [Alphaproteobacteria bacterium]
MILADTNVLLDIVTDDLAWADWAQHHLDGAKLRDRLAINDAVYAELSVRYARMEDLDAMLAAAGIAIEPIPKPALFLAGKAFERYRKRGGTRTGMLPDFFIGAHAVVADAPLITRDTGRYRSYFPDIRLISP